MSSMRQFGLGLLLLCASLGIVLLSLLAALGDAAAFESGLQSSCPPPDGWVFHPSTMAGSTLEDLAEQHQVSVDEIRQANCLPPGLGVPVGRPLYLPSSEG